MIDIERKTKATIAVILARVSSKEQEEGYSIDAQKHRLENYCDRRGLSILKAFEIVESSTNGDRKKFLEVIKFIKSQKKVIALVADKVDRVQRSFREYPLLDGLIQDGKIELHFNTENYIIHKDSVSQERLMWSMGVIMAQSYVDSLRDNVKRSIDHKLRIGEWCSAAPIGYHNVRDERGRSNIIVDESRAALVRRMFDEYATGLHSIVGILQKTREWGLKSNLGKQGYLSNSQVHNIINNPFYYGQMKVKSKLYNHRYPPLITKEKYDQCQAVLKGWRKTPFKWAGKEFVFRGILTCATTGRLVSSDTKTRAYKNGNTAQWTYLRCNNPAEPEKYVYVREDEIIKQVQSVFQNFYISPGDLEIVLDEIRNTDTQERSYRNRQLGELQKEQNLIQIRLDSLMDLFLDGAISKQDFERKREALRNKQFDVTNRIENCQEGDNNFKNAAITMISTFANASALFEGSEIERKREILKLVFSNLMLKGTTLCYEIRNPFNLLEEQPGIEKWRTLSVLIRTDFEIRQTITTQYGQWQRFIELSH